MDERWTRKAAFAVIHDEGLGLDWFEWHELLPSSVAVICHAG
jgi:hypothetical protein